MFGFAWSVRRGEDASPLLSPDIFSFVFSLSFSRSLSSQSNTQGMIEPTKQRLQTPSFLRYTPHRDLCIEHPCCNNAAGSDTIRSPPPLLLSVQACLDQSPDDVRACAIFSLVDLVDFLNDTVTGYYDFPDLSVDRYVPWCSGSCLALLMSCRSHHSIDACVSAHRYEHFKVDVPVESGKKKSKKADTESVIEPLKMTVRYYTVHHFINYTLLMSSKRPHIDHDLLNTETKVSYPSIMCGNAVLVCVWSEKRTAILICSPHPIADL